MHRPVLRLDISNYLLVRYERLHNFLLGQTFVHGNYGVSGENRKTVEAHAAAYQRKQVTTRGTDGHITQTARIAWRQAP